MKPPPKRPVTSVFFAWFFAVLVVLLPQAVSAQVIDVSAVASRGLAAPSVEQYALLLTVLIRCVLGLFGFILFCRAVWGMFLLATHGGSSDAHEEALATVKGGVVGLLVVAIAVPFVGFLIGTVVRVASGLATVIA